MAPQIAGVDVATFRSLSPEQERYPSCGTRKCSLTQEEHTSLRFQFGSLEKGKYSKYLPYVFTEQGVAMLSGVLNSPRAVTVNEEIMRAFVRLRQMLLSHEALSRKLVALEKKYDDNFKVVFEAIRELMTPPKPPAGQRKKIGFGLKESRTGYRRKEKSV